ncbi:MAG: toxin-antitoxin system HicB family antitoxin [Clostridia bacterium]|nr:toxin-antitoxin system HicB family antitoxin [Clostridia bacterium]
MFTVKKTEYTNKTFRVPTELLKKLEIIAQNKSVSLNNLVIQCCEYALENIEEGANVDVIRKS